MSSKLLNNNNVSNNNFFLNSITDQCYEQTESDNIMLINNRFIKRQKH